MVDIRALIEDLYQTTFPMDFAAVLASPAELHPLATDAATGQSTDLRPFIGNPAELRLALRASAALPLLAGPPVEFAGRRFYDAGVSESVPYRTALAQGATHLLILRSRRAPAPSPDASRPPVPPVPPADGSRPPVPPADASRAPVPPADGSRPSRPPRSARLLARTTLRRETPALRATFLARESRRVAPPPTAPSTPAPPIPDQPSPRQPQPPPRAARVAQPRPGAPGSPCSEYTPDRQKVDRTVEATARSAEKKYGEKTERPGRYDPAPVLIK